jgi:hypothetical protein
MGGGMLPEASTPAMENVAGSAAPSTWAKQQATKISAAFPRLISGPTPHRFPELIFSRIDLTVPADDYKLDWLRANVPLARGIPSGTTVFGWHG